MGYVHVFWGYTCMSVRSNADLFYVVRACVLGVLIISQCTKISAMLSMTEGTNDEAVCCSGTPKTALLLPVPGAWEKRCSMITRSCMITCRLRKSLRATRLLTERLLGRLPTNCPVTITNTLPPAVCLPLTPHLWGGRLSGSALRYSISFPPVLELSESRSSAGGGHRPVAEETHRGSGGIFVSTRMEFANAIPVGLPGGGWSALN